jgi:hypothetical protein
MKFNYLFDFRIKSFSSNRINHRLKYIHIVLLVILFISVAANEKSMNSRKKSIKHIEDTMTLEDNYYGSLNRTFSKKDIRLFKDAHNNWDYKLLSKSMEDIFSLFLYQNKQTINEKTLRAVIELFVKSFESCDLNQDNVLDLKELQNCIRNNKYFRIFDLDTLKQPKFMDKLIDSNKDYTNLNDTDSLADNFMWLIDEWGNDYLNFHDFMLLRLVSFAWRKCGNIGFFIDEVTFECAFEIVAKPKTLSRKSNRHLFKFALEFSNFRSIRYLDLPTFISIALKGRLYSRMNTQENDDLTQSEFTLALESSLLPIRYNREVIKSYFRIFTNHDDIRQGLDLYNFIFLDSLLKIFSYHRKNKEVVSINYGDFVSILTDYNFPKKIIEEMYYIPYFNLTEESYQVLESVKIKRYFEEKDFLLRMKFLQKRDGDKESDKSESKKITRVVKTIKTISKLSGSSRKSNLSNTKFLGKAKQSAASAEVALSHQGAISLSFNNSTEHLKFIDQQSEEYNNGLFYILNPRLYLTFNFTFVTSTIFHMMDFPQQNNVSFENFFYFIEIAYMFKVLDKNKKGKLTALALYEDIKVFSNIKISHKIIDRAEKLKSLSDSLYLNLLFLYSVLRVDDIADHYIKKDYFGVSTNEMNMKLILERVALTNYPENLMRNCIKRHEDSQDIQDSNSNNINVAEYDWFCIFNEAMQKACNYVQIMTDKKIIKNHNIKLFNTQFLNH